MAYSTYQMRRIREALRQYKKHGGPIGGKQLSWPAVAGAVELYTSLEISSDNESGSLENLAEKLRQFVNGSVKSRGNKPRNIDPSLLRHIVEFLTHKEVKLLELSDGFPDEIDSLMVGNIYSYLNSNKDAKYREYKEENSEYFAGARFTPIKYLEKLYPLRGITKGYSICHTYFETHILIDDTFSAHLLLSIPVPSLSDRKERGVVKWTFRGSGFFNSWNSSIIFMKSTISEDSFVSSCKIMGEVLMMIDFYQGSFGDEEYYDAVPLFDHNIRENIRESPLFKDFISDEKEKSSILNQTNSDYENYSYEKDLMAIIDEFNPSMAWYSVQHRLQAQENYYSNMEISDPIELLSRNLLDLIISGSFNSVASVVEQGARFDYVDESTGLTALHLLAHLGWRDGVMLALSHLDRCNFLTEDHKRRRASYHAAVYGGDQALARLLRLHEDRRAFRPTPGLVPN